MTYNEEDCRCLILLVEKLAEIQKNAASSQGIDFADKPKQNCTDLGGEIHKQLDQILKYAHLEKRAKSIRLHSQQKSETQKNMGGQKGHKGYRRLSPAPSKAGRVIQVRSRMKCPKHREAILGKSNKSVGKTIIDLHFTNKGCKKTITRYIGKKRYCNECKYAYSPPAIQELGNVFGRGWQAFIVHQRVALKLPYRSIRKLMDDLYAEPMSSGSISRFTKIFAEYYQYTERLLTKRILSSSFVHADETRLNIRGKDHYVWVFTDGRHVVFRMTETRESKIIHEFFSGYDGVLISDFYPGYDSFEGEQQKCWVHLIRDINNELWKAPFDLEFESFVLEIQNLIVPILDTVEKRGLKKRYLNKFGKDVDRFYSKHIDTRSYESEPAIKFHKRFQRYRDSLFLFIHRDGIPWENNMAERAIRHLAVQRKISGSFHKDGALQYLLLLGIAQTCRFQDKSFLRFMLSGEKDIYKFKERRRKRVSISREEEMEPVENLEQGEMHL